MKSVLVIFVLFLGYEVVAAEVSNQIYTKKEIEKECTWIFWRIFGAGDYYLAPNCSDYWYCDNKPFFNRILILGECTGMDRYFDPEANDNEGVFITSHFMTLFLYLTFLRAA